MSLVTTWCCKQLSNQWRIMPNMPNMTAACYNLKCGFLVLVRDKLRYTAGQEMSEYLGRHINNIIPSGIRPRKVNGLSMHHLEKCQSPSGCIS